MMKVCHPKNLLSFCFSVILFFFSATLYGQTGTITGKLTDSKGIALRYANVSILKGADSILVHATLPDSTGGFSIAVPAPGTYFIRITSIGLAGTTIPAFQLSDGEVHNIGTITLIEEVKDLKGVTITSMRTTITQLADRMVVGIEGTSAAAGNTAYTVLTRAPGVFIDHEGNIQLNGKAGVTVMIDGKQTYLSPSDLRNLLESMSAENIKNIELITNPSSKYDAQGSSGIININLKKNTLQGITGNLNAGASLNKNQLGFSYGGTINHRVGKWNSFLTMDASRRVSGREATFTRIFYGDNKNIYFDQTALGNNRNEGPPSVRLGTDYTINDKHSVGFMAYYSTLNLRSEFLTDTYIGNSPGTPFQFIDADNFSEGTYKNFTSNVHWVNKLDTLGSVLSADLDYVKIRNRREGTFNNYFTDLTYNQTSTDFLFTDIPSGFDIYSAKVDMTRYLQKEMRLEFGGKISQVISDNDSRFYFNNGSLVPDPLRSNHFNYRENIYAGYVNLNFRISKMFTVQGGLRAENTVSKGESYTTKEINKRNYLDFFPTLFVQQKISENYGINYSYSRRLSRPNYGFLNPFRSYRDPYTWEQGNPYLLPQYTHAISIAQSFKKTYHLTFNYQLHRNILSELPILNVNDGTTIYTTGNVNKGHSLGLTAVAPVKITKKWDTQNTMILSYNKVNFLLDNEALINDRLTFFIQSNHTILLPLGFRYELSAWYRGKAVSGLYLMDPMWRADMGLKKSFFNKKIDLTLNVTDLFKTQQFKFSTNINGNVNEFDQYLRFRTFGFSLRYHFSKGQKVDTKRRNTTVEETNRL